MEKIDAFRIEVEIRLNELQAMLVPGAQVAFVAHVPGKPEQDIFIFSGDPCLVRDAVSRRVLAATAPPTAEWPHPDGFGGGVDERQRE